MRSNAVGVYICAVLACLSPHLASAGDNPFPLGKKAVPRIYWGDVEPPVGISVAYWKMTDRMAISDFSVTVGGQPLPPGTVVVDHADTVTNIFQARFDTWVLPFVNVYGFAATVNGSVRDVPVTVNPIPGVPATAVPPIALDFNGHVYSVGAIFAAGYKKLYASYDLNRAWTTLDVSTSTRTSVVQTIRAGIRTHIKGNLTKVYAGASLRNGKVSGSGSISELPGTSFSMTAKSAGPWNTVIGTDIGLSKRLFLTIEAGVGTRKQFIIMPRIRF